MVKKIKFSVFHEGVAIIFILLRIEDYCALLIGITFEFNAFSQENEPLLCRLRSLMRTNARFLTAVNY